MTIFHQDHQTTIISASKCKFKSSLILEWFRLTHLDLWGFGPISIFLKYWVNTPAREGTTLHVVQNFEKNKDDITETCLYTFFLGDCFTWECRIYHHKTAQRINLWTSAENSTGGKSFIFFQIHRACRVNKGKWRILLPRKQLSQEQIISSSATRKESIKLAIQYVYLLLLFLCSKYSLFLTNIWENYHPLSEKAVIYILHIVIF